MCSACLSMMKTMEELKKVDTESLFKEVENEMQKMIKELENHSENA